MNSALTTVVAFEVQTHENAFLSIASINQ